MLLTSGEIVRKANFTCLSCRAMARPSTSLLACNKHRVDGLLHQRKHSSSKASSTSKDESRALASTTKTASGDAKPAPSADLGNATRPRRRRLREPAQRTEIRSDYNLPSVPSTQGLRPLDIQCAKFFSQHRPISVSHIIPPSTSIEAFSALFDTTKKTSKAQRDEVIETLTNTVDSLDLAASRLEEQKTPKDVIDLRTALTEPTSSSSTSVSQRSKDVSSQMSSFSTLFTLDLNDLALSHKPFVPPPPPVPLQSAPAASSQQSSKSQKLARSQGQHDAGTDAQTHTRTAQSPPKQQRTYTSTVTVHETTHTDGTKTFKTFATPIVRNTPRTSSSASSHRTSALRNHRRTTDLDLPPSSPSISRLEEDPAGLSQYEIDDPAFPSSSSDAPFPQPAILPQPFLERLKMRKLQLLRQGGRIITPIADPDMTGNRATMYAISVKRQRKLKMKKHKYKKLMKRTRTLRRKLQKA